MKIALPEIQYYTEGRIDNLHMAARANTDAFFTFKLLCAVLKANLSVSSDIKVAKIVVTNPSYSEGTYSAFSGAYVVGSNPGGQNNYPGSPWWEARYMDNNGGRASVTLECYGINLPCWV